MGGISRGRGQEGIQFADSGFHDAESLKGGGERVTGVVLTGLTYLSQDASERLNPGCITLQQHTETNNTCLIHTVTYYSL